MPYTPPAGHSVNFTFTSSGYSPPGGSAATFAFNPAAASGVSATGQAGTPRAATGNDWYVSSAAYATYTAFQTSHAYSIGDLIVPTAPAAGVKFVFRCTTAGTSSTEPAWPSGNNSTVTTGGAHFANVTGQSTFFWTAAAGDYLSISTFNFVRFIAGDRVFISSDHAETLSSPTYGTSTLGASFGVLQVLCVNRDGSTPPVAADLTTGATLTASSGITIACACEVYHYGIAYICTGTSNFLLGSSGGKANYFKNCSLFMNNANAGFQFLVFSAPVTTILDNTTLRFGNVGQGFGAGALLDILWINTPNALAGAIFPSTLFGGSSNIPGWFTVRGVDLSAITTQLVGDTLAGCAGKVLFESCKIASGVTRYSITAPFTTETRYTQVDLINCFDGTNVISETWSAAGSVTTEFTITLSSGAQDDAGSYSHKMVSNVNADKFAFPLAGFWIDINYITTGVSKTATVEIISSSSLNNDDIALYLEYQGTAGSSVASFANSFIATPLTTAVPVTTSTATWNSSPATPQKQKLQVTFTPQQAGRLRGQVRLGKASATVYVNPQITVT